MTGPIFGCRARDATPPCPLCRCVRFGALVISNKRVDKQDSATQEDKAMHPVGSTRLMILLTTVATASLGCVHTQQPERKVYVIAIVGGALVLAPL